MQQEVSTFITKASNTATYGGSSTAIFFGLTANEFAAIGGLVVAVIGLVVNISVTVYYKRKHYLLAKRGAALKDDE